MEQSDPENFELSKLVHWFDANLKKLQHVDFKLTNENWFRQSMSFKDKNKLKIPLPPLRPDP